MPDERDLINSGFRYALSLTHDDHLADDLVQQACLSIFKRHGRLLDKNYLFVAIRHLFIDHWRRNRRQSGTDLADFDVIDPAPSHIRNVDGQIDMDHLLAQLRNEEREVLYLNYVEGFTAEEIGTITNRPRGTVLSLLSRAKKKVVDRFEPSSVLDS